MTTPNIRTDGPLTLAVAWGVGGRVHGRMVNTGQAVAEALRQAAAGTVSSMSSGHAYDPDADMEENTHLVADRIELLDTDLVETLEAGAALPLASQEDVRTKRLSCYAAVIGSGDSRTIFVRKRSPVKLATQSIVATLFDGTLNRVEEPILAFDDRYDAILTSDKVYVLDKKQFESMFKDSDAVLAKAPAWVDALAEDIPVSEASKEVLVESLRRNTFYRSKFHAILRRPHVKQLTPQVLKKKMLAHGLNPDVLMPDNELNFSPETMKDLLRLLNEDLFIGDFSSEQFAAGSKRRLASGG